MTTSLLTLEIPLVTQWAVFFYTAKIVEMFCMLLVSNKRILGID